ncbi:SDR family oxidoreductase [Pseudochelatococcus sp. B33]
MTLSGKVAIVTGAGSGFGEGIARLLAKRDAFVTVNDLVASSAEKVAADITAAGGKAIAVAGDVSERDSVNHIVERTKAAHNRIDVLVNNAGYTYSAQSMLTVSTEEFEKTFDVNVRSVLFFVQAVVPIMAEQGGGSIVNIGSVGAIRPRAGLGWYCASKGAVITATKAMAVELADRNVRVNCICPAIGETGMLEPSIGEDTQENRARVLSTVPLGRFCTPADIAAMAAFLATDEASYITGAVLPVDGGRSV